MSAPEILVRLLVALLFFSVGAAVLLPALVDRRASAVVVMVAIGGIAAGVAITWPRRGGDEE